MGSNRKDQTPPEENWARETRDWTQDRQRIQKIATGFPERYREDLEAELAGFLLVWKRRASSRIRDWNAYLNTSLRHKALSLVKRWRRRDERVRELNFDEDARPEPTALDHSSSNAVRAAKELSAIQLRLSNADRHLLSQLRHCGGKVSRLAKRLGLHRNTIHRRLRRIRETRCPVDIESAPSTPTSPRTPHRVALEAMIQMPSASTRQIRRARLLLALLDGLTYAEIAKNLGAAPSTIARWHRRFDGHKVSGMRAAHPGKARSQGRLRLEKWLRARSGGERLSIRLLARRFGLSKSTVQRILESVDDGAF